MSDLLAEASSAIGRNDLAAAERFSLQALAINPTESTARLILGVTYARTRRFEAAVLELEKVLRTDPDSGDALNWITDALRKSGRLEEALEYATRSAKLFPGTPEPLFSAAMCQIALGRYPQAEVNLRRVLENSRPPSALHFLGACLIRQDRPVEAMDFLEEARKAEPSVPNHLVALGQAKFTARAFQEAITLGRQALELRPVDVSANLLVAQALGEEGEIQECEVYIRRALASDPNSSEANGLYGMWMHQMGRFSEAEPYLDKALEVDPGQATPLFFKSQHRKITAENQGLVDTMEWKLKSNTTSTHDKITLLYGLGKAFDDLGQAGKSFEHYDAANALSRQTYKGEVSYDPNQLDHFVDNAIATFSPDNLKRWREFGNPSDKPILILGMIRSGTTLMEQLLSAHQDVFGAGELFYWMDEALKILDVGNNELNPEQMAKASEGYLRFLDQKSTSRFVTDKMPTNHWMTGFIHASLPNAKIIHMLRDPLDVALSIWMTFIRKPPDFANHKGNIIATIRQHERLRQHWLEVLPADRYIQIHYEELTRDPESVMRQVLGFCNLNWDEACIHPENNNRFVSTPSLYRVRRPIDASSVSKKDRFEPYLGEFSRLIGGGTGASLVRTRMAYLPVRRHGHLGEQAADAVAGPESSSLVGNLVFVGPLCSAREVFVRPIKFERQAARIRRTIREGAAKTMSKNANQETVETLDAETLEALDEGIALAANGRRWTMEEAFGIARKRREEWKTIQAERLSA